MGYIPMIPNLLIPTLFSCSFIFDATLKATATSIPSWMNQIVHGGRMPFSPRDDKGPGTTSRFGPDHVSDARVLESDDGRASYLVDKNGNAYEPYSLAWRYLGMYIDCDVDQTNGNERRFLEDGGSECERVLLWAAYVDLSYRSGTIGEYQFYDLATDSWDKSTCKTKRCAKMDCHEPHTHFKLVGVFKESDGIVDWAEQLFKHEGYCVWTNDEYSFMQNLREMWPTYCVQASLPDSYGNTLYMHILPQGFGNMTVGIFSDDACTQESSTTSFSDYVVMYYTYRYGSEDQGADAALTWEYRFETWNEYMSTYKICQPCRAYSLNKYDQSSQNGEGRYLENDGEGDEEQWGYNCYDQAGYMNCNQCYKFETKTDLEPASTGDLVRASKQGTILAINVNGKMYGSGGFGSETDNSALRAIAFILGAGLLVGGVLFGFWRQFRQKLLELPPSFKENLQIESQDARPID